jgi:putative oxidoreductase
MFGLPGILLAPTILLEVGAGLALLVGFKTRYVAFLLAGFAIVSAAIFHADFGDQIQQILFLKNLSIAGGFLLLAKIGAPGFSVDQFLAARKGA